MAALGPFDSFHLFCDRSLFTCRPPSKALINKRKLCKPVGTSEKEEADKKTEEEEEEDAEDATKLSVRAASRSSGLVRTSFVKVWYRIRASNNITHPARLFDHSPRETSNPPISIT